MQRLQSLVAYDDDDDDDDDDEEEDDDDEHGDDEYSDSPAARKTKQRKAASRSTDKMKKSRATIKRSKKGRKNHRLSPKRGISINVDEDDDDLVDDQKMNNLYDDVRHPGSYSGIDMTLHYSRIKSRRCVIDFLSGQDAYTLHKPIRKRFRRRKVFSKGIADLVQADLVDLSSITRYNDGYRYLLTAIDVFTKRALAIPLKTKSGREVTLAFDLILRDVRFNMVQTDKGTEFKNAQFQTMLSEYNMHHYTRENDDLKASIVERFNRTLKGCMFRYSSKHQTRRYLDVIDDLIQSYNNTCH